jgi:hypothetical protein
MLETTDPEGIFKKQRILTFFFFFRLEDSFFAFFLIESSFLVSDVENNFH